MCLRRIFSAAVQLQRSRGVVDIDENWSNFEGAINLSEQDEKILRYCSESPRSRAEIFDFLKMSNETRNFNRHILPLLDNKLMKMTLPDKPRSMNQKYMTTDLGSNYLIVH